MVASLALVGKTFASSRQWDLIEVNNQFHLDVWGMGKPPYGMVALRQTYLPHRALKLLLFPLFIDALFGTQKCMICYGKEFMEAPSILHSYKMGY